MELIKRRVQFPRAMPTKTLLRHIALGVLLLTSLISPNHATAQTSEPPILFALPNGGWRGIIATAGPINAGGMSGFVTYNGWSQFSVVDGAVPEGGGEWHLTGDSVWIDEVCSGTAMIKVDGVVTGTADMPILQQTDAVGNGTVQCGPQQQSGVFTPVGPPMTAAITWDAVTCEEATGSFAFPANALVASGGASSNLVAPIRAFLNLALPTANTEGYLNEVADVGLDGINFMVAVESTHSMNFSDLDSLINRSQELYRALRRITDCDRTVAGQFMNSLRDTIASLIDTLLENPDLFSMSDLERLAQAAIQTGLIGEGAVNQEMADQYEQAIVNEVTRRLEGEEGDDCAMAGRSLVIGHMLGSGEVIDAGFAAFDAACGGG